MAYIPPEIGNLIQQYTTENLRLSTTWRDTIEKSTALLIDQLMVRFPGERKLLNGEKYATLFTSLQDAIASDDHGVIDLLRSIIAYPGYLPVRWDLLLFSFPQKPLTQRQKDLIMLLVNSGKMHRRYNLYASFLLRDQGEKVGIFNPMTMSLTLKDLQDDYISERVPDYQESDGYRELELGAIPRFFAGESLYRNYQIDPGSPHEYTGLYSEEEIMHLLYILSGKRPETDDSQLGESLRNQIVYPSNTIYRLLLEQVPSYTTVIVPQSYPNIEGIKLADIPMLPYTLSLTDIFLLDRPDLLELVFPNHSISEILDIAIKRAQAGDVPFPPNLRAYLFQKDIDWGNTIMRNQSLSPWLKALDIPAFWRRQIAYAIIMKDMDSFFTLIDQHRYEIDQSSIARMKGIAQRFGNNGVLSHLQTM